MIKTLSIKGFRGYSKQARIDFGMPNSKPGSGLNIIVGPNNSGKSTIVESINAFNTNCSFSEGKRNQNAGSNVILECADENNILYTIKTKSSGGSEVDCFVAGNKVENIQLDTYVLPSRRFVNYEFSKDTSDRGWYIRNTGLKNRKANLEWFQTRLFAMQDNKDKVDGLMSRILGKEIQWAIDQRDNGSYYVRFQFGNLSHSSEGVGDGLWSILTICDALYDSKEGQTIVIDEPELSLHPLYQKRLMELLLEYSETRQIIICTHSPYFVSWQAISNGAHLIRTNKKEGGEITISQITQEFRNNVDSFLHDIYNPHVLGIEASEVFFTEDNIILTEGQEDVVAFNKINKDLGIKLNGNFFGWGSGGAGNEAIFLKLFKDLGYEKVVAIFDGDKKDECEKCQANYPDYQFFVLPADDVRDKEAYTTNKKEGISTKSMDIKSKFEQDYREIMDGIKLYFSV